MMLKRLSSHSRRGAAVAVAAATPALRRLGRDGAGHLYLSPSSPVAVAGHYSLSSSGALRVCVRACHHHHYHRSGGAIGSATAVLRGPKRYDDGLLGSEDSGLEREAGATDSYVKMEEILEKSLESEQAYFNDILDGQQGGSSRDGVAVAGGVALEVEEGADLALLNQAGPAVRQDVMDPELANSMSLVAAGLDEDGGPLPSASASDSLGRPTGAPPPQHRVRRYLIPGLDELGRADADMDYYDDYNGVLRRVPDKPAKPTPAPAAGGLAEGKANKMGGSEAAAAATVTSATTAAQQQQKPPQAPTVPPPPPPAAVPPSPVVGKPSTASPPAPPTAAAATDKSVEGARPAAPASSLTAARPHPKSATAPPAPSPEKVSIGARDVYDADDPRVLLPNALVRGITERNKRIKTVLMATLGSDFAKAGVYSDGVRTSFSVVSYQTVKQRTGLKSIPSKLLVSCLTSPDGSIDWIDISAHPTATLAEYKEAIQEVLVGLGMHATMVDDSTEPMLLPQITVTKECQSLLMRYAIDVQVNKRMDSFQDLTNRFTLFVTSTRVITVHRTQCTYVEELKKNWLTMLEDEEGRVAKFLTYYLVKETVATFMRAISKCIVEFDRYEAGLFSATRTRPGLAREIYHIKRRAAVYGRTLTLTKEAYAHMAAALNVYPSNVNYQEVLHDLSHMENLAEELNANADSVLQLLFQLSSYQVNELMRVLTLFSAFFIPLSFIAACYGMNFENLPFIKSEHGEVFCAALMAAVAGFIYFWFKSKRFI